jgi:hypothetical protein
VIAGTQGGLFRSTDEGRTWTVSSGTNPVEWVLDLDEFGGELFATGLDRKAGELAVYRSQDSGMNWIEVAGVSDIIVPEKDPVDGPRARLAVGPSGIFIIGITSDRDWVVYRSTDDGQTWDGPLLSLGSLDFEDLYDITLTTSGTLLVGSSRQIRRSTDNGVSWTEVHDEASSFFASDAAGAIYAARPGFAAIYSSVDDGQSWTQIYSSISIPNAPFDDVYSLATGAAGEVYAGLWGAGVAGTTDGGTSWTLFNNGFAASDFTDYETSRAVLKLASGTLLAGFVDGFNDNGSVGGVYYSSDNGANWTASNAGMTGVNLATVLVHSTGDIFSVEGSGDRLLRSQDDGDSWSAFQAEDVFINRVEEDPATGDLYLAANFAVLRSENRGDTWVELSPGTFGFVEAITVTPTGTIIAADDFELLRSTDGGASWTSAADWGATAVASSPSGTVFALQAGLTGVFRSDDDGLTWYRLNDPGFVDRFALAPNGDLYISRGGLGLSRSTDGGANWSDAGGDLPRGSSGSADLAVESIAFDANSNPYIATGYSDAGDVGRQSVFTSADGGQTWEERTTGFEVITWVNDVDVGPAGVAYAATSTGLYRSSRAVASERVDEMPRSVVLFQNYPNPFNPTTRIRYELPDRTSVALTVFDVLGRLIQVQAAGVKPAGVYEVPFDASGLPSGVYIYRLEAGDFVETKRMVILR